jgi:hypothetical protein
MESAAMQPPLFPNSGPDYQPVVTLNGWDAPCQTIKLPSKLQSVSPHYKALALIACQFRCASQRYCNILWREGKELESNILRRKPA